MCVNQFWVLQNSLSWLMYKLREFVVGAQKVQDQSPNSIGDQQGTISPDADFLLSPPEAQRWTGLL